MDTVPREPIMPNEGRFPYRIMCGAAYSSVRWGDDEYFEYDALLFTATSYSIEGSLSRFGFRVCTHYDRLWSADYETEWSYSESEHGSYIYKVFCQRMTYWGNIVPKCCRNWESIGFIRFISSTITYVDNVNNSLPIVLQFLLLSYFYFLGIEWNAEVYVGRETCFSVVRSPRILYSVRAPVRIPYPVYVLLIINNVLLITQRTWSLPLASVGHLHFWCAVF